jgi:hypothetical protein
MLTQTAIPSTLSPAQSSIKAFLLATPKEELLPCIVDPELLRLTTSFYLAYDIRGKLKKALDNHDELLDMMLFAVEAEGLAGTIAVIKESRKIDKLPLVSPLASYETPTPQPPTKETQSPPTLPLSNSNRSTASRSSSEHSPKRKRASEKVPVVPLSHQGKRLSGFVKKGGKIVGVVSKKDPVVIDLTTPSPSPSRTPERQPPTPSSSKSGYPYPSYMSNAVCYHCQENGHFSTWCPLYQCPHCRNRRPKHSARDCPRKTEDWNSDYEYFDFDDDAVANMTGEPCGY